MVRDFPWPAPEPDPSATLEERVELLERQLAELRADLEVAQRNTALAHQLLAIARRDRPPPTSRPPPEGPSTPA
jgi:hypothetical protein